MHRSVAPVGVLFLWIFAGVLSARQVPITIVHTTDVHGYIAPTTDYDGNENVGGMLRAATLIQQIRAEQPNMLLLDGGDLYQGSMESYMSRGRIMNDILAFLRYDAWVLGNHEFDWGWQTLAKTLEHGRTTPVLGANVQSRPGTPHPLPTVRPYIMKSIDGVRVAIVGLTTDGIPNWSRPHLLGDIVITDSVDSLKTVLAAVKAERPDIIVLLTHQGYRPFGDNHANQVNRIAQHFPEIDIIIGGHSYQNAAHAQVNGVLYAQAGYHGIWVGRIDLVYDTVARHIARREGIILHAGEEVEIHSGLQQHLQAQLAEVEAFSEKRIGELAEPIPGRSRVLGQSATQQLICRAIAAAADVDIVLHGTFSSQELNAGSFRERDLWALIPYENTIGVLHLTAAQIASILDENSALRGRSQFLGVYGIRYDLHEDAGPGERIHNLRLADGSAMHPRRRYRVALNSYVLASGGQRFITTRNLADAPINRLVMTGIDTRSAVRDYIKKNSPLQAPEVLPSVRVIRGD